MQIYWAAVYYFRYVRNWFVHRIHRCDSWCPICYQEFAEESDE